MSGTPPGPWDQTAAAALAPAAAAIKATDFLAAQRANKRNTWLLIVILLLLGAALGYVGGAEPISRNVVLGQIAAAYYFAHFLIILPLVAASERPRPLPGSITEAVLAKHGGTSPAKTAIA